MTRTRGGFWALLLWAPLAGVCAPTPPESAEQNAQHSMAQELSALDVLTRDIEQSCLGPALFAEKNEWPVRHTQAQIAFHRQDYMRASVILSGVLEDSQASKLVGYVDAAYELAESLFQIRNFNGARKFYSIVYERGDSAQRSAALARLLAIAMHLRDDPSIAALLAKIGGSADNLELDAFTRYGLGKFYYRQQNYTNAAAEFQRVPASDPLSLQAHYFLGVIDLREGQSKAALQAFAQCRTEIEQIQEPSSEARQVSELAMLAQARLLYEEKQYDDALNLYAQIPFQSQYFQFAIEEVIWLALRAEDIDRALVWLDLYLASAPADQLAPPLRFLKGMLLSQRGALDQAEEYFSKLSDEFDAYLATMQSAFETELAERKAHAADSSTWRLPRRPHDVLAFIEPYEPELRIMALSDELARMERDWEKDNRTLTRLERVLQLPSRVKFFPELYDGWLKVLEIRGRVLLARSMLNAQAYPDEAAAQASPQRAQVLALEAQFRQIPMFSTAARARDKRMGVHVATLQNSLFQVELLLQSLKVQSNALKLHPHSSNEHSAEIAQCNAEISDLMKELERLQGAVDEQYLSFGERDSVALADEALRSKFAKALEAETQALSRSGRALDKASLAQLARIESRAQGMARELARVGAVRMERIAKEAAVERSNLAAQLAEFKAKRAKLQNLETEIARVSYERALALLGHYARQARFGVLNVSWRRKELLQTSQRSVAPVSDPDVLLFVGQKP